MARDDNDTHDQENTNLPILIADDDDDILNAGRLLLKRHYNQIDTCNNPEQIPDLMRQKQYGAILLDMNFSPGESDGNQGFFWLKEILNIDPDAVVILITAHAGLNIAIQAMKLGATDFISKPWQNEKVVATLSASMKLRKSRNEARHLKQTNSELIESNATTRQPMLGESVSMQQVRHTISRAGPTEANVLILGENGTGKELVARAIHQQSNRGDDVFMSVDLGSITESLFESELFGHKRGAFTDAREDRIGRLQAANGGTLFLDEIGNLPLHLQAKLLTVLERRCVSPVGSSQEYPIDIRIVAATNLPTNQLSDDKYFRQDLLFRLNTIEITLPPLRERLEDIPTIARYFGEMYCKKYNQTNKPFTADALHLLQQSAWPGNIRALRHAIERAVILCRGNQFEAADFPIDIQAIRPAITELRSNPVEELNLEKLEVKAIHTALTRYGHNISQTAKALGLTRAALYRRMEKYGL